MGTNTAMLARGPTKERKGEHWYLSKRPYSSFWYLREGGREGRSKLAEEERRGKGEGGRQGERRA